MSGRRYFTASDGEGEPTLWEHRDNAEPLALLRRCDLPPTARHLWFTITNAVVDSAGPDQLEATWHLEGRAPSTELTSAYFRLIEQLQAEAHENGVRLSPVLEVTLRVRDGLLEPNA